MILQYNGLKPKIGKNVFIAPTATIIGNVEIADGASIWYGTVVRGDTSYIRVGRNSNIQDNCTVHTEANSPVIIGEHVTIGHNAVIHGCTIADRVLIGIGAIILNGAAIHTGSIVAAGSLVKQGQQVDPHCLVAGSPAAMKKKLTPRDAELISRPIPSYRKLADEHARSNPSA